jgi:hypothetical protein
MFGRRTDRELAATKYAGRESATQRRDRKTAEREEQAAAKRRADHRRSIPKIAAESERWENADRARFAAGIFRRR